MASVSPVLGPPLLELGGVLLLALAGLWMVRRRLRDWAPVLLSAVGWTVSTVVFFLFSRYRLPVVPALLLLAAVPVAGLVTGRLSAPGRLAIGGLALVALALPHLLHPAPRRDLVAYNLGILAQQRGEIATAGRHFDEAVGTNPEMFSAWLSKGNVARLRGDLAGAADAYRRAAGIEPASTLAWSNLGGALMVAGDAEGARAALERVLAIDPADAGGLNNLAVLAAAEGERDEALALLDRLLATEPEHEAARELRERLMAPPDVP
jgi:tetratricopeptide (TPR) repeat protein